MNIREQIERLYREQPQPRTFVQDAMRLDMLGGYVLASADAILLGREVPLEAPVEEISGLDVSWPLPYCNTWFVWLAVGDLAAVLALIPHEKKWVAFARVGKVRFHQFNGLLARLNPARQ